MGGWYNFHFLSEEDMGGWYSFHFLSEEDLRKIVALPWVKVRGFLAMYAWYVSFNPLRKTPKNKLIWVKFPGFPLEFWTKEVFTDIGNAIGKFIYVDPRCLGARDKRIAWVLIEKYFGEAFPDHIELRWDNINLRKHLDFWGIPFTCLNFCQTGHLIAKHPKGSGGWQPSWEREGTYDHYEKENKSEYFSPRHGFSTK